MPWQIAHLRRWFAVGAIAIAVIVAGSYLYARWRFRHLGGQITQKINVQIQQSAQGFSISKSEEGRTLFTIRASNAVQYKQGGRAELHDVNIIVYGRDSHRFDQIYGANFEYDPQSGIVTAKGEVQIDLEANPEGLQHPDQAPPRELKNPVHLKTSGLVFNQKSGDAYTSQTVEFRIPEASGSAEGATYRAKEGILELRSKVQVAFTGASPGTANAGHAVIRNNPRQIELDRPQMVYGRAHFSSDRAIIHLRQNSTIEKVAGTGAVHAHLEGNDAVDIRSEFAELLVNEQGGTLRSAVLSGNVQMTGGNSMQSNAGRLILQFSGKDVLATARAEDKVRVTYDQAAGLSPRPSIQVASAPKFEFDAPVIDFTFKLGRYLRSAVTSGAAQAVILPTHPSSGQRTVVTAGQFRARFDERGRLRGVDGAPEARIVTSAPGQADRASTSDEINVAFQPSGGIESIVQRAHVVYTDANLHAWGDSARYTPADQVLYLTGSPRVVEAGMTTTARAMRMVRSTGDAFAEGDVKSTYSELKPQPNGALLASSDPIHVTSSSMVIHRDPGIATYTGNARLWQDANVVEAPSIEFDRERRSVIARGKTGKTVSTVLAQDSKGGQPTLVAITSDRLKYTDSERKAHFEGGVTVKSTEATITASQLDIYLLRRTEPPASSASSPAGPLAAPSRLEKIVAEGGVVIVQPGRRAEGHRLVYAAAADQFVLTGGSPSIFDAEHGKITGDSLTFYRRDGRVLVEGEAQSPTVTQTRVAR